MYADISRDTYRRESTRTRLLFQQGRASTDAEENEQVDLILEDVRRLATYVLGPYWGPAYVPFLPGGKGPGLEVDLKTSESAIGIGPGLYVIGGLTVANRDVRPFPLPGKIKEIPTPFVVAVEAREHVVTTNDDPDLIDPALGAWDSSLRAEIDWAPRVFAVTDKEADTDVPKTVDKAIAAIVALKDPRFTDEDKAKLTDAGKAKTSAGNDPTLDESEAAMFGTAQTRKIPPELLDPLRGVFRDAKIRAAIGAFQNAIAPSSGTQVPTDQFAAFDALLIAAGAVLPPEVQGRLRSTTSPPPSGGEAPGDCDPEVETSYRGPENRCYRVEVHRGGVASGDDPARRMLWKWSRENGSVTFGVKKLQIDAGTTKTQDATPRTLYRIAADLEGLSDDPRLGLRPGQLVEIVARSIDLGEGFPLPKVESADVQKGQATLGAWLTDDEHTTLQGLITTPAGTDVARVSLRRWDHPGNSDDPSLGNALDVPAGAGFIEVDEDGVFVEFEGEPRLYRRGDYWLIPARAGEGILWPAFDGKKPADDAGKNPNGFQPPRNPPPAIAPLEIVLDLSPTKKNCRRVAPTATLIS